MEVKDIIKEDRNKIVPSYEHRDYYREDGSYLYNSNREANWYKLGILDCFDYFEHNRLKACDTQTPEEAERELNFVIKFFAEHHRQPTFSDAIEETRRQIIDKIVKWIDDNAFEYVETETVGIMENYKRFDSERMIADLIKVIEE